VTSRKVSRGVRPSVKRRRERSHSLFDSCCFSWCRCSCSLVSCSCPYSHSFFCSGSKHITHPFLRNIPPIRAWSVSEKQDLVSEATFYPCISPPDSSRGMHNREPSGESTASSALVPQFLQPPSEHSPRRKRSRVALSSKATTSVKKYIACTSNACETRHPLAASV
jgi:hypothetical protein